MSSKLLFVLLCAGLIGFISCEKESLEPAQLQSPLPSDELLTKYVKSPILFQYIVVNNNSDNVNSWFITRSGEIKIATGVKSQFPIDSEIVSKSDLEGDIRASQSFSASTDPDPLWNHYLLSQKIKTNEMTVAASLEDRGYSEYFLSYLPLPGSALGESNSHSCYEGRTNSYEDINTFLAIRLESYGETVQINKHSNAVQIVDWLKSLDVVSETPE